MSDEKRKELEEMEKANGEFGESESSEGKLNEEEAAKTVGGYRPPSTAIPRRPKPTKPDNLVRE